MRFGVWLGYWRDAWCGGVGFFGFRGTLWSDVGVIGAFVGVEWVSLRWMLRGCKNACNKSLIDS